MNSFLDDLNSRLAELREKGLHRELRRIDSAQSPQLRIQDQTYLNFSSNDYLGLANHPLLREAAHQAIDRFGAGSGASRLICGSLAPHHELERLLASFKGTEATLAFSSGHAAAVGTISALLDKSGILVLDKLIHASLVDGARLSGARLRVFPHNDLDALEALLKWADHQRSVLTAASAPRVLVVTESIFSMNGDAAPLRQMVDLKDRYGAWLMVDEAHATGLYGPARRGWAEACGVADRVEIQMGTLSKAIGSAGGFVCGSRALIDVLVNRARSFIFSTAPVPAAAAAAAAGIRLIQSSEGEARCRQLWQRVQQVAVGLVQGWPRGLAGDARQGGVGRLAAAGPLGNGDAGLRPQFGPIIPLIVGKENEAVAAAATLRERGVFIPAVRYPAVARGAARLRLTLSAAHTEEQVARLLTALSGLQFQIPNLKLEISGSATKCTTLGS